MINAEVIAKLSELPLTLDVTTRTKFGHCYECGGGGTVTDVRLDTFDEGQQDITLDFG